MNFRQRNMMLSIAAAVLCLTSVAGGASPVSGSLLRIEISDQLLPLQDPSALVTLLEPRVYDLLYPPESDPNVALPPISEVLRIAPVADKAPPADGADQSILLSLRIDLTAWPGQPPLSAQELQNQIVQILNQDLTGYYNEQVRYLQQRLQALGSEIARAEQQYLSLEQQLPPPAPAPAQTDSISLQQQLAEVTLSVEATAEQIAYLQAQVDTLLAQLQRRYETDPLINTLEEAIEYYLAVLADLLTEVNRSPYEEEQIAELRERILKARLEITQRQEHLTENYEGPQIRRYYDRLVQLNMEYAGLQNREQLLSARAAQAAPPPIEQTDQTQALNLRAEAQARELQRLLDQYNRIQSRLNLLSPPQIIVVGG